jgi:predicted dehydrogenase
MKRIKIAVVGLNFGRWIIKDLLDPEGAGRFFELVAVCDTLSSRTEAMAAKSGVPGYTDIDEMLKREEVPTIGLFTGPSGRSALIRKLLDAGKDVMTTKPFEVDPDNALEVLRYAQKIGRVLHLNSPAPVIPPDLQQIQQWRNEHGLGRPIGCRGEVWTSYREKSDGSWQDDPGKCPVAPIFRLGIYLINDLVWILGEADRVQVMHSRIRTGRPTPDNAQLGISFKNGALASIYASFCVNDGQDFSNSLLLNYENGSIYRNVGKMAFSRGRSILSLVSRSDGEMTKVDEQEFPYKQGFYQWETFYHAVQRETAFQEISPEQIVAGLKIISAMARSERSGASELV